MTTSAPELHKGLKQRHLTMIAIGGVIGAGLFVGSGVVINEAGPAAFLTYAHHRRPDHPGDADARRDGDGQPVDRVVRRLRPARRSAAGPGFSVGWLYWYFWVIVVGFEAVAGAKVITYWFDAPLWLLSLGPDGADDGHQPVLGELVRRVRVLVRRDQGRRDHASSSCSARLYVLGIWPNKSLDFSNLTAYGGFFPNGVGAIFSGIVVVIFSMVGAEIATIAAAESEDPARAIAKATNSVIVRIAIFFVGSVFLLAVHPAVELDRAGRLALRQRLHRDGHPVRRPHHERGGADRGAVLPELGPVHGVPDAVRAGRPAGGAGRADHGQQARACRLGRS